LTSLCSGDVVVETSAQNPSHFKISGYATTSHKWVLGNKLTAILKISGYATTSHKWVLGNKLTAILGLLLLLKSVMDTKKNPKFACYLGKALNGVPLLWVAGWTTLLSDCGFVQNVTVAFLWQDKMEQTNYSSAASQRRLEKKNNLLAASHQRL